MANEIASSNLTEPSFEACLRSAVATLVFPKPEGGGVVVVRYPFVFAPESSHPRGASAGR